MSREVVATSKAPEAMGAYSQAVVSGDHVFCSGQVPLDPASGELISGTVADETRRCMDNLSAVLEASGTTLGNVVKVTAFLADIGDFAEFNEAYADYFPTDPPARAAVGVAGLPKGARVEIECVARR
jgi:2-iminobutanoate/2-iminopropanoate deaminase